MNETKLIYIHLSGTNWDDDNFTYQLLFSNDDNMEDWEDDTWGIFPASGRPIIPPKEVVTLSFTITTSIKLILAQNSQTFRMYDAIDGIIPIGYEDIDDYDVYPDERLVLHYGETPDEIEEKLSRLDITPTKKTQKNE